MREQGGVNRVHRVADALFLLSLKAPAKRGPPPEPRPREQKPLKQNERVIHSL